MVRVTRRAFIGTAVATAAVAGNGVLASPSAAPRPSARFIVADDVGHGWSSQIPALPNPMNIIAERYVKLVLALGQHARVGLFRTAPA